MVETVELEAAEVWLVSPEKLVSALTVEEHGRLLGAREAHHAPLEVDRRREERLFLVPVDPLAFLGQDVALRLDGERIEPRLGRHQPGLFAFRYRRVLAEPSRERVLREGRLTTHLGEEAHDQRGIQPAGQARPNRHVGAKAHTYARCQQFPEALDSLLLDVVVPNAVVGRPVAPAPPNTARRIQQQGVGRRDALDASEERSLTVLEVGPGDVPLHRLLVCQRLHSRMSQ